MKSACHERIIIRRVAEYYQLCTAQRIIFLCCLGCLLDNLTHKPYRIHIQSCFCRSYIHRAADTLCLSQRLRNRTNQILLSRCHSLGNQSRIAANKVYAHFLCCPIQGSGQSHKILRRLAGAAAHQSNRSNRNSLVYNRHTEITGNGLSCRHQILCIGGDFSVNFFIERVQIAVAAVQQADTHCNGAHIQLLMLNHIICFIYLKHI